MHDCLHRRRRWRVGCQLDQRMRPAAVRPSSDWGVAAWHVAEAVSTFERDVNGFLTLCSHCSMHALNNFCVCLITLKSLPSLVARKSNTFKKLWNQLFSQGFHFNCNCSECLKVTSVVRTKDNMFLRSLSVFQMLEADNSCDTPDPYPLAYYTTKFKPTSSPLQTRWIYFLNVSSFTESLLLNVSFLPKIYAHNLRQQFDIFSELHDAWNVQPSLNRRPSAQTPSLQDIGSVYTVIIIDACMLFSWAVKNGNNFSLHRCL